MSGKYCTIDLYWILLIMPDKLLIAMDHGSPKAAIFHGNMTYPIFIGGYLVCTHVQFVITNCQSFHPSQAVVVHSL